MKKQYFLVMSTIILVVILLGVSFAWYSSNTRVSAGPVTVTAAKPDASDVSFVYSDKDYSDGRLYISDVRVLTDPYGRSKYQGETGVYTSGEKSGSVVDSYSNSKDYVYTTYYSVTLNNSATTDKQVTFKINAVNIYKAISKSEKPFVIDGIDSDNYNYELKDGTLILTEKNSSGTTETLEYSVNGAFIYSDKSGSPVKVGHLGKEEKGENDQFQLGYTILSDEDEYIVDNKINPEYEFPAEETWSTTEPLTISPTATSGAASSTEVIIAIRYSADDNSAFKYSSTDYMGAWFNFEIEVTEDK